MTMNENHPTVKRYLAEIKEIAAEGREPPQKRRGGSQEAWRLALSLFEGSAATDSEARFTAIEATLDRLSRVTEAVADKVLSGNDDNRQRQTSHNRQRQTSHNRQRHASTRRHGKSGNPQLRGHRDVDTLPVETTVDMYTPDFADTPMLAIDRVTGDYAAKTVYISGRLAQWLRDNPSQFLDEIDRIAAQQDVIDES